MTKSLICPCEDVTLADVDDALERGFRDLESVKRYTGLGTGICQGKSCLYTASRRIVERAQTTAAAALPFTPRPPLYPIELGALASAATLSTPAPSGGVPPDLEVSRPALRSPEPLRSRAKVVIIGAGVLGLALAHNLALHGETDVVVLEQGYLCAGASGRNGGGVRMQWGTPSHIALAKRSIELMGRFAKDLGIHIWLRQNGYLFLAQSPEVAAKLERSAALQNRFGVETQLLTPDAAREIVPGLTLKGTQLCAYHPKDGVVFPWPFLWGYAQSCARHGISVETFTRVTGFALSQGKRIGAVETDRGTIACETVVLAAGAWSPQIARLAGIALPNRPQRHEILSTEGLKPFLGPLVSVLDSGLYFSQSMRGEIVGGMGDPREAPDLNAGSTFQFLTRFSQAITEQLPRLARVKVLRQWAGSYDVTPDNNPILGRTPGLPNLLQLSGFVGHGMMMAPAVGERMAAWMATGESDELFSRYNLARFSASAGNATEREEMIIG